jgi:hypothetical protein
MFPGFKFPSPEFFFFFSLPYFDAAPFSLSFPHNVPWEEIDGSGKNVIKTSFVIFYELP